VVHLIVVLVIVSFALLYLFISVNLFIAPLFWNENNALPLNYPPGTEFAQLVVKIATLLILSVILPNPLPIMLLPFFISIFPICVRGCSEWASMILI